MDPRPLKLFVVGESSPDPDEWSEWGGRALVIAHDEEEAVGMVEGYGPVATAIPLDESVVLMIEEHPPDCL